LYPYVALQDMPGISCDKLDYYSAKMHVEKLFGFFYCDAISPKDSYLGLLPYRTKSVLKSPLGS